MKEPFPELHALELGFAAVAARLGTGEPAVDDDFNAIFAKKVAEYNKAINGSLKNMQVLITTRQGKKR